MRIQVSNHYGELNDQKKAQLEYLLADYHATKAEISRRSNLQRASLLAYAAVIAIIAKEGMVNNLSSFLVVVIWIGSLLTLMFYIREGLEICRLGGICRDKIAATASGIIKVSSLKLLPSETDQKDLSIDNVTINYNRQFKWAVFFIVPTFFTLFYLSQDWGKLAKLAEFSGRAPYMATISFGAAIWCFLILLKRINFSNKNTHS